MKTCAVIMAAHGARRWIGEAIRSIQNQEPRPGWVYELRIGVDGCEDTSLAVSVPHLFSPDNVGPYLIRNSLIAQAPADAYAIFDADDLMLPEYLSESLACLEAWPGSIVGTHRTTINEKGRKTSGPITYVWGVCTISAPAWKRLGAYRPWRIRADADLIQRARALRIPIKVVDRALFRRRVHQESLTMKKDTRIGSALRLQLGRESMRLIRQKDLRVPWERVPLEYRPGRQDGTGTDAGS